MNTIPGELGTTDLITRFLDNTSEAVSIFLCVNFVQYDTLLRTAAISATQKSAKIKPENWNSTHSSGQINAFSFNKKKSCGKPNKKEFRL